MIPFPTGRRTFFLETIEEPETNVLRVLVGEAEAQGSEVSVDGTDVIKARLVSRIPGEPPWELRWDTYIAYAVRNESYSQSDRPNTEDRLIVRSNSAFLDFVKSSTFATRDYPGEFSHWELICADHVIDVVSVSPPEIRRPVETKRAVV